MFKFLYEQPDEEDQGSPCYSFPANKALIRPLSTIYLATLMAFAGSAYPFSLSLLSDMTESTEECKGILRSFQRQHGFLKSQDWRKVSFTRFHNEKMGLGLFPRK